MGKIKLILGASVLLFGVSFSVQASIIHFNLDFVEESGPSGTGSFSFDDCTGVACPSLDFEVSFGNEPGLIFDTVLEGGAALSILGFFEGDPNSTSFPGTNFDSQDGINLLSLVSNGAGETSGVYCLRLSVGAGGLCDVDPNVFGSGTWSATPCSPFPGGGATEGCFPGPGPFPGGGVSAVPVPAAAWLFGTGLIGLIGFTKRRKAA